MLWTCLVNYWVSMFLREASPGINKGFLPNTPLVPGNASTRRHMDTPLIPVNDYTRPYIYQLLPCNVLFLNVSWNYLDYLCIFTSSYISQLLPCEVLFLNVSWYSLDYLCIFTSSYISQLLPCEVLRIYIFFGIYSFFGRTPY